MREQQISYEASCQAYIDLSQYGVVLAENQEALRVILRYESRVLCTSEPSVRFCEEQEPRLLYVPEENVFSIATTGYNDIESLLTQLLEEWARSLPEFPESPKAYAQRHVSQYQKLLTIRMMGH